MRGSVNVFAPSNIALVKYWGKRDTELNLPVTSSLSIGLKNHGCSLNINTISGDADQVTLNGEPLEATSDFVTRLSAFLDVYRPTPDTHYELTIDMNIPVAAGLASSACGFAALVKGLNALHEWNLSDAELSVMARRGSGSACRSLWDGFVAWQRGEQNDGSDSHGIPIDKSWPALRIGLLILHDEQKPISSREAMQRTVETSPLYAHWPETVEEDMTLIRRAIDSHDFDLLGATAERNALAMHATMQEAEPAIVYNTADTDDAIQKVQNLRADGLSVYFTQDAGPNLKLLFQEKDLGAVQRAFPDMQVVVPFPVEQVVLVDEQDQEIGMAEKLEAHEQGLLHRAFSVMVLRDGSKGTEVLMQRRAEGKYHSGGLWTNTCCSHPRPGESVVEAAERRLTEEMGFTLPVREVASFVYRAELDHGLVEHEFDHVLVGDWADEPIEPNPQEVSEFRWWPLDELRSELSTHPKRFTAWLQDVLKALPNQQIMP